MVRQESRAVDNPMVVEVYGGRYRLVGLVVKASASKIPGSNPACTGIFIIIIIIIIIMSVFLERFSM